jgi:hypothetical protein
MRSRNEETDTLSDQAIAVVRPSAFLSAFPHFKQLCLPTQFGSLLYCVWRHWLIDSRSEFRAYTEWMYQLIKAIAIVLKAPRTCLDAARAQPSKLENAMNFSLCPLLCKQTSYLPFSDAHALLFAHCDTLPMHTMGECVSASSSYLSFWCIDLLVPSIPSGTGIRLH